MKSNFILHITSLFIGMLLLQQVSAQNSNVTINAASTTNGGWSGTTVGPYIFTPTGDNATIINSDIQNRLLGTGGFASNNVTIRTVNGTGTQSGDVVFSATVTAATTSATQRAFTVNAGGNITINSAVNLTPATPTSNGAGRPATTITLTGINISINAAVTTKGGTAFAGLFASGGIGATGGNISVTATGAYSTSAAGVIVTSGGDGKNGDIVTTRVGGAAGIFSVTAPTSISVAAAITANGGAPASVANGGAGGNITLSSAGNISVSAAITANAGAQSNDGGDYVINSSAGSVSITAALSGNAGSTGGNGGDFSITGANGITMTANISSTSLLNLSSGSITINDGNPTVTSGGNNDGQTGASVFLANNFIKNGAGTFNMAGANTYVGSTTINGGKIRVSNSVTGTSAGAFGANSLSVTTTINNAGLEFNNATFTRGLTVSGNTTLDAYGAARSITPTITGSGTITIGANTVASAEGQDLTLGAAISSSLAIVKSFSSSLTLSVANSFTGNKTLNAGTLNINNATALGTVAGTFIINGGTINNSSAGAITISNYLQTWGGDFSFTGTQNLNLGTGAVTMSANRQVTVNANTLTIGGIIAAGSLNLTKAGAGTLAFGATAKTFRNLTVSAGTLTSTSTTLNIAGDFSNSGTYTHNSGTVVFNGTTQSIAGSSTTAFSTLTILNGSTTTGTAASTATTFNINSGGKYIQTAGSTMPGSTKNFVAGSTYELQASGVTFSGSTYGTLILNYTSGNMSAGGNLTTVLNDLYVQNTGTGSFRLAAGTSPTVTISGKLKLDAGTLNFSTGAGAPSVTVNGDVLLNGGTFQPMTSTGVPSFFVKGNWVNNGATFTPGTTTVNFNSSTDPQNISGSVPNIFYNLTNSNTVFFGLSLDADITVTNVFSFSSASEGEVSTGSNTVFVSNGNTTAVVHPGQGYVVGNLKRRIGSAGGNYDFAIGSFTGYTPVSLSFNNGNTAGDVNVTTSDDGVSPNYPVTLSSTKQLARTWTITNGGGGSFTADGIFTFLPGDLLNGATDNLLKGYKFDAPSTYAYSANTSNTANTFSFNGITSFSEFGAGECTGDLAVAGIITDVTCFNGADGAITTSVTGNTTPVTYSWNTVPIQTTANISGLIAGSYTVIVTEQTTCSATNLFTVSEPPAVESPVSGGDQTVCSDGNPGQALTATATSAFPITWYDALTGGNIVPTPQQVGVGTVTYYAEAFNGTCPSFIRTAVTLKINPVPLAPVSGGNQSVCENGNPSQTITATATSPATITWYDAATAGNVVPDPKQVGVGTVTYYAEANDGTCSSLTRTAVTLTINAAPVAVGTDQTVCTDGTPTQTITATATGGTITWYDAATGGNIVSSPVQVGVGSSTYYAEAFDGTCTSLTRDAVTLTINPPPATPSTVNGPTNVCPYIGTGEQITYSVNPVPFADRYRWIVPPTVTIVSASPDSSSINVTIGNGFIANANKLIRVRSISTCGNSAERFLYLLAQFPSTPAPIIASTSNVCPSIGTGIPITYTIPKVVAATSYLWLAQAGTTNIVHTNGEGINDTTVTVTFESGFTTSAITVRAVNACGSNGGVRSLTITRNNPSQPGLISGPTNVCQNVSALGTAASYSIAAVNNAVSYTWTVPAGAIGLTGQGTTSISFTYPEGYTSGSISVTATNNCGTGISRSLSVTSLKPATPGVIDVIQQQPCPDRQYSYTIASMPANAQSVQWSVPAGATLLSGQGTTSILVSYPATTISGNITATSTNNCGSSVARISQVKLPACPGLVKGNSNISKQTTTLAAEAMQLNVFPNPFTTDFKLQVITAGKESIRLKLMDIQGRVFKELIVAAYQTINIGAELKAGSYLLQATQGNEVKTIRVLKF